MDYRSLLLWFKHMGLGLHGYPGDGGFDSHAVASHFHMSVKHASNDLRRLWRMGFLRRTCGKRTCFARGGKFCIRGFEYRYYLSSQGMKYVKWLQGGKMIEDFNYANLTSEVLSYLPDELKDRLSMLSLAKATMRYKGPSRNTNLLDSNIVPVTHLSTQNMKLQSQKERLELENAIQKFKVTKLEGTINNYEAQNTSLYFLLAQAVFFAASNKNSAETWEGRFAEAFWKLAKLSPLEALSIHPQPFRRSKGNDANTLNPTNDADAPLFDPRTDISHIPAVMGRAGVGAPISLVTSWREYYGKTYTLRETKPEGRILAKWQITPENAERLVESVVASGCGRWI